MMSETDIVRLIAASRAGDVEAKPQLLTEYRDYLRQLAHLHVKPLLTSKFDESDIVQETCMQATRSFDQFRGDNEKQLAAWLRQITANKGAEMARNHLTGKRDVQLETQLQDNLDRSSIDLAKIVPAAHSSPSQVADRAE